MAANPTANPVFQPTQPSPVSPSLINGLLDMLLNPATTSIFGYGGANIPTMQGALPTSTLHNTYSINGIPVMNGKPVPSILDLDGITPVKYWDIRPH